MRKTASRMVYMQRNLMMTLTTMMVQAVPFEGESC